MFKLLENICNWIFKAEPEPQVKPVSFEEFKLSLTGYAIRYSQNARSYSAILPHGYQLIYLYDIPKDPLYILINNRNYKIEDCAKELNTVLSYYSIKMRNRK